MEETKVIIRAFKPIPDAALIYSTWRNALWYGERRDDDADMFYMDATKAIKRILEVANVRIACLSDDHDLMVGYSVMTGSNIEFVYVKLDYREKGVGALLVKGFETWSTPQTKIGRAIVKKIELAKETKEKQNVQEETKRSET